MEKIKNICNDNSGALYVEYLVITLISVTLLEKIFTYFNSFIGDELLGEIAESILSIF